jgi:hypothetical protein
LAEIDNEDTPALLHPTASKLEDAEIEYAIALRRLSIIRNQRNAARREHRSAIVSTITDQPTMTNVDIAAWFNVAEGTIRNIRKTI